VGHELTELKIQASVSLHLSQILGTGAPGVQSALNVEVVLAQRGPGPIIRSWEHSQD